MSSRDSTETLENYQSKQQTCHQPMLRSQGQVGHCTTVSFGGYYTRKELVPTIEKRWLCCL
jgi:hypothetical protein